MPSAFAQSALALQVGDLRIEQRNDGGYHLFVRAKSGIASILLTESTKDPENKSDSFAFRSLEKNPVNDGEARVLDGKKLPTEGEHRYLVSSSPRPDPSLGTAFHVFIPWVVAWGHSWSRSGKVYIHDGTFINIRTFAKPYADYSGAFADNPYLIRVTQAPRAAPLSAAPGAAPPAPPPSAQAAVSSSSPAAPKAASVSPAPSPSAPEAKSASLVAPAAASAAPPDLGLYFPETIEAFGEVAKETKGELRYASSDADILNQIDAILARVQKSGKGESLDFVLCVDATDSMLNGVDEIKAKLPAVLAKRIVGFSSVRMGIVSYKDYFEEYLYKRQNFVGDAAAFAEELDSLHCGGGRDIPEAVYEALYASACEFPWAADERIVVLVGDAPPHPIPCGSVDKPDVLEAAASSGVELDAVAVPK
jgi:hypothetical protein